MMRSIPKGLPQKKEVMCALKSFQFAQRGHGYYDAFVQTPGSVIMSATTGPATVIKGHPSDTSPGSAYATTSYQGQGARED